VILLSGALTGRLPWLLRHGRSASVRRKACHDPLNQRMAHHIRRPVKGADRNAIDRRPSTRAASLNALTWWARQSTWLGSPVTTIREFSPRRGEHMRIWAAWFLCFIHDHERISRVRPRM